MNAAERGRTRNRKKRKKGRSESCECVCCRLLGGPWRAEARFLIYFLVGKRKQESKKDRAKKKGNPMQ